MNQVSLFQKQLEALTERGMTEVQVKSSINNQGRTAINEHNLQEYSLEAVESQVDVF